jgi:hypothetical protein
MLPSIQFNREPFFMTIKVQNIRIDWMLTPELAISETTVSEKAPYQRFGIGLRCPEFACET